MLICGDREMRRKCSLAKILKDRKIKIEKDRQRLMIQRGTVSYGETETN